MELSLGSGAGVALGPAVLVLRVASLAIVLRVTNFAITQSFKSCDRIVQVVHPVGHPAPTDALWSAIHLFLIPSESLTR